MSNEERKFSIVEPFLSKIRDGGFTFCGVFDEPGNPSWVYSINGTPTLGAEYIIIGDTSTDMMYKIMSIVIDDKLDLGIHELSCFGVTVNDVVQDSRIEIIDVSNEPFLDDLILSRCDGFNKVYQILFGDLENKLPTELGNLDNFKQMTLHSLKSVNIESSLKS